MKKRTRATTDPYIPTAGYSKELLFQWKDEADSLALYHRREDREEE
jgi:hypothetical protein